MAFFDTCLPYISYDGNGMGDQSFLSWSVCAGGQYLFLPVREKNLVNCGDGIRSIVVVT